MSRVEKMADRRDNTYTVALHKFRLNYSKKDSLFCFFEGEDSKYYSERLYLHFSDNHQPLLCGGKKGVINVYNSIKKKESYNLAKKAFFIDKDFDSHSQELVEDKNVYITPSYSIENFYCNEIIFSRILKNEFYLAEFDRLYIEYMNQFKKNLNDFLDKTTELNSWIRYNKIENPDLPLNLKNVTLSKLIKVEIDKIEKIYTLEELDDIYSVNSNLDPVKFSEYLTDFIALPDCEKNWCFRGKYLSEFIFDYLKLLINQHNKKIFKKNKVKLNLSKKNLISELSGLAVTPECLIEYINIHKTQ